MKKLIASLAFVFLLGGCAATAPGTSAPTVTSVLSTKVDMVAASKAAYAARASYFVYLTVAEKVRRTIPICAGTNPAPICITADQMALLRTTEASAYDATLAGVNAVQTLAANPTALMAAVTLSEAAVAQFKSQTDIWAAKVKS